MAFPSIRGSGVVTNDTSGTGTTVAVNLPLVVPPGDILLVLVRCAAAGAISWPDASWNELFDASPDASVGQVAATWKRAQGTEGGTTITITKGSGGKVAAIAYSIRDAADPLIRPPEISTVATGTSAAQPNATAVTPTGGSKDYLFITTYLMEGEQTGVTSYPASYTLGQLFANTGTAGAVTVNATVGAAARQLTAASDDAGAWTVAGTLDDWSAYTIAFHPPPADPAPGAQKVTPQPIVQRLAVAGLCVGTFIPHSGVNVAAWRQPTVSVPTPPRFYPQIVVPILPEEEPEPPVQETAGSAGTTSHLYPPPTIQYTPVAGPVAFGQGLGWAVQQQQILFKPPPVRSFVASPITPTGVVYTVNLSGSIASVGVLIPQTSLVKTGSIATSGLLVKTTSKVLSGSIASSGVVVKTTTRILSGSIASSGVLVRSTTKVITGTISSSGTLVRNISKPLTGAIASAGALSKTVNKFFAGTIASSSAITNILVKLRNFTGTINSSGSLVKNTSKALSGTVGTSGVLTRSISRLLAGSISSSGSVTRVVTKVTSGAILTAGALVKTTTKVLTGISNLSGVTIKSVSKALVASITPVGEVQFPSQGFSISLAGTIALAGQIQKSVNIQRAGTISSSGALVKVTSKPLAGAIASSGNLIVATLLYIALAGTVTLIGVVNRTVMLVKTASITTSSNLTKIISKGIGSTIALSGLLSRSFGIFVDGSITLVGTLTTAIVDFFTQYSVFERVMRIQRSSTIFGMVKTTKERVARIRRSLSSRSKR